MILHELREVLAVAQRERLGGRELKCLLALVNMAIDAESLSFHARNAQLATETGIDSRDVRRTVRRLVERGIIERRPGGADEDGVRVSAYSLVVGERMPDEVLQWTVDRPWPRVGEA